MTTKSTHSGSKLEHLPILDGIRAIAVLLVVWYHLPLDSGPALARYAGKLSQFLESGYFGVDLFFVLSGFLITRILLSEKQRGDLSFKRFYAKRTLRIFPIYYLTLLVVFLIDRNTSGDLIWSALYLSNYSAAFDPVASPLQHTWSLAVEEQFYLLWPLLIAALPLRRISVWVCYWIPGLSVLLTIICALTIADEDLAQRLIYRGVPFRALSLALGAALAVNERRLAAFPLRWIAAGFVGSWTAIVALKLSWSAGFQPGLTVWVVVRTVGFAGASFFAVWAAVALQQRQSRAALRLLANNTMQYVGRLSYGIYLYHYPIIFWVIIRGKLGLGVPQQWFVGVSLCVLVPVVSYHFVEAPILALKRRWLHASPEPASVRAATRGRRGLLPTQGRRLSHRGAPAATQKNLN